MHVAYFSNQFADLEGHGNARYARELYGALVKTVPDIAITPCSAWSSLDNTSLRKLQERTGLKIMPWGRRLTPLAWTFLKYPPIESWLDKHVDVVHAVALGYPVATRKPFVVTVHDIGPLTHPQFFTNTKPWIMERSLARALAKADAIICVSQSTADELERYTGSNLQERLHVVHEGVSPLFFQKSEPESLQKIIGLPDQEGVPYILAAGKISPRKNVVAIIQALARIKENIPHHLVLVGAGGWDMEEVRKTLQDQAVADRVHFTGYLADEQLRALYNSASVYVHPSLYEGFGLTVLEAMAAGCPVVTSNLYSLPEVAGDAAVLVDPHNIAELAEAIRTVCMDAAWSDDLRAKGLARAKMFTWERCAEQVAGIYRTIA